ncbi:FAD-binding protein [Promicromonospora soli]
MIHEPPRPDLGKDPRKDPRKDPSKPLGDSLRNHARSDLPSGNRPSDVLLPGDDGYADAATTFFASGRPAVVVRPHDAAGVAAAIAHARREGLVLSVRSGGHGLLGTATNNDGMVLDLAHLDAVELSTPSTGSSGSGRAPPGAAPWRRWRRTAWA